MQHIYVHVPFCRRRCVYCDFAISVRPTIPGRAFAAAIGTEVLLGASAETDPPAARTLYFGGGTPSLLDVDSLGDLTESLIGANFAEPVEVTIEANPDDVTVTKAAGWRAAGVNRASLGVQSFQDNVLEWMHRTHTARDAITAATALRGSIPRLSLDLIFGLPPELGHDFAADLERALALEPEHLSVYGLTVEPGTPLGKWVGRGVAAAADDPAYAAEFMLAHDMLTAAGFEHYEVSNYARPGCRAVHNSGYWLGASYTGLGPSAHSFDAATATRSWNLRNWAEYERCVAAGHSPTAGAETLTGTQLGLERLYLGLRTLTGVPLASIGPAGRWERLIDENLAVVEGESLVLTPPGWLRSDQIAVRLTTLAEGG